MCLINTTIIIITIDIQISKYSRGSLSVVHALYNIEFLTITSINSYSIVRKGPLNIFCEEFIQDSSKMSTDSVSNIAKGFGDMSIAPSELSDGIVFALQPNDLEDGYSFKTINELILFNQLLKNEDVTKEGFVSRYIYNIIFYIFFNFTFYAD